MQNLRGSSKISSSWVSAAHVGDLDWIPRSQLQHSWIVSLKSQKLSSCHKHLGSEPTVSVSASQIHEQNSTPLYIYFLTLWIYNHTTVDYIISLNGSPLLDPHPGCSLTVGEIVFPTLWLSLPMWLALINDKQGSDDVQVGGQNSECSFTDHKSTVIKSLWYWWDSSQPTHCTKTDGPELDPRICERWTDDQMDFKSMEKRWRV